MSNVIIKQLEQPSEITIINNVPHNTFFLAELAYETSIHGLELTGYRLWLRSNKVLIDMETSKEFILSDMVKTDLLRLHFKQYKPVNIYIVPEFVDQKQRKSLEDFEQEAQNNLDPITPENIDR